MSRNTQNIILSTYTKQATYINVIKEHAFCRLNLLLKKLQWDSILSGQLIIAVWEISCEMLVSYYYIPS